jgi:hypothetical protein
MRVRRLLALALLATIAITTPASAVGGVQVDNSLANGIAQGAIVRADPASAVVTVANRYHFWAGLTLDPATGGAQLRPASLLENPDGIYGRIGLIGPGAMSTWDGTFDPERGGSQAVWVHYDLYTASGATALGLTVLTIVADTFGAPLLAKDAGTVMAAVTLVTSLPEFAGLEDAVRTHDVWTFEQDLSSMLQSKAVQGAIVRALALLGANVAAAALPVVGTVVGLLDFSQTVFDLMRAGIEQHTSGQVTFSLAAAPTPTPTATPAPTPTVIPGGRWIAPSSGAMISGTTLHFAAHAYPTHPGDPPIDHVNFTIWWPALGPQSGPWKLACPAFSPGGDLSIGASDVYACDADLAALGAPPGSLLVSFDVYDTAGDRNLAPNGEHRIVWSPPVTPAPTVMLSPPAPPTGVSVTNAGPGALLVTWTAPAGDVSGYRLRVFTDFLCDPTPCGSQLQQTYTVGPTVTSYAVGGLDGMYCFDVSAFNAAGDSSPSDRTCGGTNPFPPIPTQAWSVTLTAGTTSAIVGEVVPLSAVASHSLTGTGYHIEIRHAYTDQPYQVCALEVSPCTYQLTWPMQGGTDVYAALLDGTTVIASSTPFWIIFANPG